MRGVDAGNPICSSVTRAGSRIHSHARTTCTMSAGIRSSLSRYGWPTTRSAAVSLCAIDRGSEGWGTGALRFSPFEITQFPLLPVALRSLSISSLSIRRWISWRKKEREVTISRYYWWVIGWQQWTGGSVSGIQRTQNRLALLMAALGRRKMYESGSTLLYVNTIYSILWWSWPTSSHRYSTRVESRTRKKYSVYLF